MTRGDWVKKEMSRLANTVRVRKRTNSYNVDDVMDELWDRANENYEEYSNE